MGDCTQIDELLLFLCLSRRRWQPVSPSRRDGGERRTGSNSNPLHRSMDRFAAYANETRLERALWTTMLEIQYHWRRETKQEKEEDEEKGNESTRWLWQRRLLALRIVRLNAEERRTNTRRKRENAIVESRFLFFLFLAELLNACTNGTQLPAARALVQ